MRSANRRFNNSNAGGGGMLKSPAELGRAEEKNIKTNDDDRKSSSSQNQRDSSPSSSPWPYVQAGETVKQVRLAKQTVLQQQTAAWRTEEATWLDLAAAQNNNVQQQQSHVTAFTYQGLEVWLATCHGATTTKTTDAEGGTGEVGGGGTAYLCLARTLVVLQAWTTPDPIVAVHSHPYSGLIVLVTSNGILYTYIPATADERLVSQGGCVRWYPGPIIRVADLLFGNDTDTSSSTSVTYHVALSAHEKILVAAADQLTIWDVRSRSRNTAIPSSQRHTITTTTTTTTHNDEDEDEDNQLRQKEEASVVWMTRLPGRVRSAAISGNGQALAVVLMDDNDEKSNQDDEADGVHTFERDTEDGGGLADINAADTTTATAGTDTGGSGGSSTRNSIGVVYKPGPFLVHSAPVKRLSFRGMGFCHSQCHHGDKMKINRMDNDLLLTTSIDGTARIFGQEGWKPLTEWVCGAQTRVDWIRGQAAFSLGDLEARNSTSNSNKRSGLRRNASSTDDLLTAAGAIIGDRTTPIPAHTTPLSQAGAWIAEISWDVPGEGDEDGEEEILQNPDGLPWISLSRLTYLKRGTGDLTPTLLDSVSTILPPVSIMKTAVQASSDALTVEGVWPAWNPFVDVPTDSSNSSGNTLAETLRGSAMAFLGLAQADGYFGDALLQGTQCPPTELRLTAAHPLKGHVVILEFHLHGQDKNLNSLELGTPIRSLIDLPALQEMPATVAAVTQHGQGSLWATPTPDGQRIEMHWRQPACAALVPAQLLPADITSPPEVVASILRGTTRFRDESLLPVPLALRPIAAATPEDPIQLLQWWPERRDLTPLHGPRILLGWKRSGAAIIWQVLPPMSERTIPEDGLGTLAYQQSSEAQYLLHRQNSIRIRRRNTFSEQDSSKYAEEYEVSITPDVQYGLGLRLESLDYGEPAIAGSFKKNPITGEDLPAERTGMIKLGDELMSANGVNLEDKTFDDIINTVREFGASASPGNPIRMRFRRKEYREPVNSVASVETIASKRRTKEQIFGVKPGAMVEHKSTGTVSSLDSSIHSAAPSKKSSPEPGFLAHLAPLEGLSKAFGEQHAEKRIRLILDASARQEHSIPPPALLIYATEQGLNLRRLQLPHRDSDQLECMPLGSFDMPGIKSLEFIKSSIEQIFLVVATIGQLQTVVITLPQSTETAQITKYMISKHGLATPETSIIRPHSLHIMATSELQNGRHQNITIWTPQMHPGCSLSACTSENDDFDEYCQSIIHNEASLDADSYFVDFCFNQTGFLDSSPLLLTFSNEGVSGYQRREGSFEWILAMTIQYGYNLPPLVLTQRPGDRLPHLSYAVRACFSSHDENNFLRSDWHPDALLTQICTEEKGAQSAMNRRVRSLLDWLASDSNELLQDFHHLPLLCSNHTPYEDDKADEKIGPNGNAHSGLFGAASSLSSAQDDKTALLVSLRDTMMKHVSLPGAGTETERSLFASMNPVDVRILLAVLELLLNPPAFKNVDTCGELFLFASALLDQLIGVDKVEEEKKVYTFQVPGILQRQVSSFSSSRSMALKETPLVASAACVSGLISVSQELIVESVKAPGVKLDWTMAKRLRMPLWVRSDVLLARISEEIGQAIFREKRDIIKCAIFFIIARKTKKLRNLAATDKSESGTKFFKFITSHDFSSERGRRAAEKNAFSLLRKCRYRVASAFFLLSEPPALQSALETIITKMQDLDLAFMVARLMESNELMSDNNMSGISGGGFMGLGGVLGGGGGYAGTGAIDPPKPAISNTEKFENWKPSCGLATKKLLVERLLPSASSDPALSSLLLLWLNQREEASWWLPGFLEISPSSQSGYRLVKDARSRLFEKLKHPSKSASPSQVISAAVDKVNALIDFTSPPSLLRTMKSSPRARCASALLVSGAMIVRGVDISCLKYLLRISSDEDASNCENVSTSSTTNPISSVFDDFTPVQGAKQFDKQAQSSIFDNFSSPPFVAKQPKSSIFDDFEPPQQVAEKKTINNPQSSIFDAFDYQPTQKVASPAALGTASSSISDSFDVPSKTPSKTLSKTPSQVQSDTMQSSIFDSFETPPTQPKTSTTSSIFDAYDIHAPSHALPQKTQAADAGASENDDQPRKNSKEPESEVLEPKLALSLKRLTPPDGWQLLGDEVLLEMASRRLFRTVASTLAKFHSDPLEPPIDAFFQNLDSFVPMGASDVLQSSCNVSGMTSPIQHTLDELSALLGISKGVISDATVSLLASFDSHHRTFFGVVLMAALGRTDSAEAIVRTAAESVLRGAAQFASALDGYSLRRRTRATISSLHTRREAVRTCWQLESCLWLHRGGGLPLSSLALKEAILAVRIGLTLGSWNRHHQTLEALLRCEPDCLLDDDSGRYLWSSLKDPTSLDVVEEQPKKTTSGGWEFLVDCRRSEATDMLRESPTGSFIIRPHPSDHGVFTLSFKTNLMTSDSSHNDTSYNEEQKREEGPGPAESENNGKAVRKDDVVQHAIVRLSDSGFRCGSFGPFSSLIELLETVSSSLPFQLRFDLPPQNRVIREDGSQPSPNAVLFRKLALSRADSLASIPKSVDDLESNSNRSPSSQQTKAQRTYNISRERERSYSCFLELLVLSRLRRQLCSIASVKYSDEQEAIIDGPKATNRSISEGTMLLSMQQSQHNAAYWILQPLLSWCRCMEVRATIELAPETVLARP